MHSVVCCVLYCCQHNVMKVSRTPPRDRNAPHGITFEGLLRDALLRQAATARRLMVSSENQTSCHREQGCSTTETLRTKVIRDKFPRWGGASCVRILATWSHIEGFVQEAPVNEWARKRNTLRMSGCVRLETPQTDTETEHLRNV